MSRITGTLVAALDGGRASVACRVTAGEGCPRCGCALACSAEESARAHEVIAALPGQGVAPVAGTPVTIEVADGALLRIVGRLYLPPLAGLLLGPSLVLAADVPGEAWQAVAAVLGFAGGAAVARLWTRREGGLQALCRLEIDPGSHETA
jgi:positive regulator of sigma E activity